VATQAGKRYAQRDALIPIDQQVVWCGVRDRPDGQSHAPDLPPAIGREQGFLDRVLSGSNVP
jgi:hypothetical protein